MGKTGKTSSHKAVPLTAAKMDATAESQAIFRHLCWYLSEQPPPQGRLEVEFGACQSPQSLFGADANLGHRGTSAPGPPATPTAPPAPAVPTARPEANRSSPNGLVDGCDPVVSPVTQPAPATASATDTTTAPNPKASGVDINTLIEYLDEEVNDKCLKARVQAVQAVQGQKLGPDAKATGLFRPDSEGQEAVDAYVSEIVAALRDFPYLRLPEGREAGSWIRDEIVAPVFQERWDFYNNKKLQGFNLDQLYMLLSGKNMLLDRLRHVQQSLNG
ncbi:unnamed protein product [Durusdinium trenchii]|uniref:Uncharacterized protein n=1 Tax=Durusdinium trenchii TaxID=1381693 RepID=A0ABP0KFQ8_9DINO